VRKKFRENFYFVVAVWKSFDPAGSKILKKFRNFCVGIKRKNLKKKKKICKEFLSTF
jgi:hypothetical protein